MPRMIRRHRPAARPTLARALQDNTGSRRIGPANNALPYNVDPTIMNLLSGAGGATDKGSATQFLPLLLRRAVLENTYRRSWAAQRMINMPVDDMFVKGRTFEEGNDDAVKMIQKAERELKMFRRLKDAIKGGKLFGTGGIVIIERDKPTMDPFDPARVVPGGIANLLVVDRWSMSVNGWQHYPNLPNYGRPEYYRVTLTYSYENWLDVHHSRFLRFDGLHALATEGWWENAYDWAGERDWGKSELEAAIDDLRRDAGIAAGIAQLIEEASLFVVKTDRFRELSRGRHERGEMSLADRAAMINVNKSLYRTLFIDSTDEAERVAVQFAGLPDILDAHARRLAAISGIPVVRFLAESPGGLNSTGSTDENNYALLLEALRTQHLEDVMETLDMAVAQHAGIGNMPPYTWPPILELSEKERAEADERNANTILGFFDRNVIDEEEARQRASNLSIMGELGPMPESLRRRIQEEMDAARQAALGMGMGGESGASSGEGA